MKRYIAVIDIADNDYYFDHIKDLKEEIEGLLYVGGKVISLKPMPAQVIDRNTFAIENKHMNYQTGYNACLDEILGDNQ